MEDTRKTDGMGIKPLLKVTFKISRNDGGGGEPGCASQCITRFMRIAVMGYWSQ